MSETAYFLVNWYLINSYQAKKTINSETMLPFCSQKQLAEKSEKIASAEHLNE